MLFTDLVDEDCIHLGGVGLLMVMARAKASNAVAFYRFQYTEYMLKHHPTEIRSILTLQKRHCKGVCFLHQFVWLDIGWNECQDGCAKSAGDLESDQKFSNWPRDLISGYALLLFCLHYFVWQTATALLKQGIWTRLLCCLAYLGKTEVASLLQESDWEEDPLSCFHMSLKIPSAAVCLWRNTIWERFLENNIKWKLNWLATSCYKEGFIGYSVRGASNFHSVAAASIEQRF